MKPRYKGLTIIFITRLICNLLSLIWKTKFSTAQTTGDNLSLCESHGYSTWVMWHLGWPPPPPPPREECKNSLVSGRHCVLRRVCMVSLRKQACCWAQDTVVWVKQCLLLTWCMTFLWVIKPVHIAAAKPSLILVDAHDFSSLSFRRTTINTILYFATDLAP